MSLNITVAQHLFRRVKDNWPSFMDQVIENSAAKFQAQGRGLIAEMLGRWQTGTLAESLTARPSPYGINVKIGGVKDEKGYDYTADVFYGAGKHWIYPKNVKALHWNRFGIDVYFKAVEHPGQKARLDILDALRKLFVRIVKAEISTLVRQLEMAGMA